MKDGRALIYLLGAALTALALYLVPIPVAYIDSYKDSALRRTWSREASTIVFGASSIDGKSTCDADRRSIPAMLGHVVGHKIVDASYSGQALEDSVQLAGLALKAQSIKHVIIATAWNGVGESNNLPLHDYLSFKVLNPDLDVDAPPTYFTSPTMLMGKSRKVDQAFDYAGRRYPGLSGFDNGLFIREKARRTCPENDGHEQDQIAAIYYHRLIAAPPAGENVRLIQSLARQSKNQGKRVTFVMLPVNVELLGRLNPQWPVIFRARRDAFLADLRRRDVAVLDLSETLPNSLFIDRWCGCSHYSDKGRDLLATQIAAIY